MFAPRLPRLGTLDAFRDLARRLAHAPPADVDWGWVDAPAPLFDAPLPEATTLTVPKGFADLCRLLVAERSGRGFATAHALLYRLQSDRGLLSRRADPDVAQAERIAKEIRRDLHKMHAFVRFRETGPQDDRRRFTAWFEPTHRIEEAVADFFVNRFGDMDWAIVTPEITTVYEGRALSQRAVVATAPDDDDALEALWTTYYSNIFNPARLKVDAMTAEMPKKYWKNLPEARAIPGLIAGARAQVAAMQATTPRPARAVAPSVPPEASLQTCTACPLHCAATQAVPGEGPGDARVMIVGEQPGDREDLEGRPFVGPAGQLFDAVATRAGLDRAACYVTNAVKHFRFIPRGKRRLHQRPDASHVAACRPWLLAEIQRVDPEVIVALGATAALALTGSGAGVTARRGTVETGPGNRPVLLTLHPSYLLRLPSQTERARQEANFETDLRAVSRMLGN